MPYSFIFSFELNRKPVEVGILSQQMSENYFACNSRGVWDCGGFVERLFLRAEFSTFLLNVFRKTWKGRITRYAAIYLWTIKSCCPVEVSQTMLAGLLKFGKSENFHAVRCLRFSISWLDNWVRTMSSRLIDPGGIASRWSLKTASSTLFCFPLIHRECLSVEVFRAYVSGLWSVSSVNYRNCLTAKWADNNSRPKVVHLVSAGCRVFEKNTRCLVCLLWFASLSAPFIKSLFSSQLLIKK